MNLKKITCLSLFLFILISASSRITAKNIGNIKAIYGFSSEDEPYIGKNVKDVAKKLKNLGINAVFCDYRDKEFVDALHEQGIKVFVEVAVFAGSSYWKSNPETIPINSAGDKISQIKWYAGLCPTQKWLRDKKLKHIEFLVNNYNVDGIWLDFTRYPCHWEVPEPKIEETCFCDTCLSGFQRDAKIEIPQHLKTVKNKAGWILKNHKDLWIKWKCENITSFVSDAKKTIDKTKPGVILGIFSVPWKTTDYNNAIEEIICQDYKSLDKFVDLFSPMVYHKLCNKPSKWIYEFTNYASDITKKDIVPIIHTQNITDKDFKDMLNYLNKSKSSGFIIFKSDYLNKENSLNILKKYSE
ncbi:MAG: hypothetical protein JW871_04810 [Endomicrobiales bacterium]|nr:hypothetical protein [Endomicrobiales bacterium]